MKDKRLTRSQSEKMLAGVLGGLANYFDIDPTLVRLGFVVLVFAGVGSPILLYLVLWLIMPLEGREDRTPRDTVSGNVKDMADTVRNLGGTSPKEGVSPKEGDSPSE